MIFDSEFFRSITHRVYLPFLVLSLTAIPAFAERSSEEMAKQRLASVMKSTSGRFIIVGTNSVENVYIAHWAENKSDKIEDIIGIKMPFAARVLRIIIRTAVVDPKQATKSWVTVSQGVLGKRLDQRLIIYNYDNKQRDLALCHLLMNGYVRAWDFEKWPIAGFKDDNPSYSLYQVPVWLSLGISQNMDQTTKAKNSSDVVARWMDGKLPSLSSEIVHRSQYRYSDRHPDKALCGVFVSWLLSVPDSRVLFGKMFSRIAAGEKITLDWLSKEIPGCGSRTKMAEAWDWWLNREKRRIYKPGTTSLSVIKDLQSELLIYPVNFAISNKDKLPRVLTLSELMNYRDKEWVKKAAKSKSISLKLMSAGRGKDFASVVELYCEYLNLLARQGTEKELKVALAIADTALKSLKARYSGKGEKKQFNPGKVR